MNNYHFRKIAAGVIVALASVTIAEPLAPPYTVVGADFQQVRQSWILGPHVPDTSHDPPPVESIVAIVSGMTSAFRTGRN